MIDENQATSQLKQLVALAAVAPLVGATLLILKFAFDANLEPQGDPDLFGRRLQLIIHLLVPLLLGLSLVTLGLHLQKLKLGVMAGIIAAALVYIAMILNNEQAVAQCTETYKFVCGEWSVVGYAFWGGMWLVDALALIGVGVWTMQHNKRKKLTALVGGSV